MAVNLDKINYQKADPSAMISCIEDFPLLCREAWRLSSDLALPSYYIKAKKFVLLGMGGSGIACNLIADLLSKSEVVVHVSHDYDVPAWVDEETIVIASSYSGDTEETLSAFIEAHNMGAKLVAITTGGKLKILSDKYKCPCFLFKYNCKPRASLPFLFVYLLSIFIKLGLLEINEQSFLKSIEYLDSEILKYKTSTHTAVNKAKSLALKLHDKTPIIWGSGTLRSVARRFKAQLNENSKNFAFFEELPESDHNAIEGVLFPGRKEFVAIFLESNYDLARNVKRQNITTEILRNNRIACERIKFVPAESPLAEMLNMILFSDFVSYYLSILNKVDPSINKNITNLKHLLDK